MAKFLPTINLWNPAIDVALRSGQLKLQRGQWVVCGAFADGSECKSRFLEVTSAGTIRCVHGKDVAEVNARFKATIANHYKPLGEFESRMAALRAERKTSKMS
ncbi:hypothetical protein [Alishewanella phage vB_AspM_Slickus01]|nr:hypothetical protein [Alishewanella phage vB_AspM_Slickus01]